MSLLLNMLSRLVITFLPRSKHLLISWLQSPSVVILEPRKIKSDTVSTDSPSKLRHVDADQRVLGVKKELGKRLGELGLADAGGSEEQERAVRPPRIRQAGPGAPDRIGHGGERLVLADH